MINDENAGFAFIKPGFIDCYDGIVEVLEEHDLYVAHARLMKLSSHFIKFAYRNSLNEHYYPTMHDYLTNNVSLPMIVCCDDGNAQATLSELKKQPDGTDGILRQKFQRDPIVPSAGVAIWSRQKHPEQDEVTLLLTQRNVIHTPDTTADAHRSIQKVFGQNALNELFNVKSSVRMNEFMVEM